MKKRTYALITITTLALLALPVASQVPMLLNYQGRLTHPGGNPQNGTFTMQFAFYDAETGGNQLPTRSPCSETQSVTMTNGVFNVLPGSVTALPLFAGALSHAAGALRSVQATASAQVLRPRLVTGRWRSSWGS